MERDEGIAAEQRIKEIRSKLNEFGVALARKYGAGRSP